MNVLVTGGCGFIGSHVLDQLIKRDDIELIINIDKLGVGSDADFVPSDPRIITAVMDLCEKKYVEYQMRKYKPEYIIHLAAESHVDRSISDPENFIQSNIVGTFNLLESARQIVPQAKIVHVSTDEVYGHLEFEDPPFVETTPVAPRSPYSSSKASSDLIALSYKTTYGMDITVTRCCNNYGTRQHDEKLIPTVIRSIVQGKDIPVYGNGQNVREWIHAADHAKALIEICFSEYQQDVYNLFGTERYTNVDLISRIISIMASKSNKYKQSKIEFVQDRPGHDKCYKMSTIYDDVKCLHNQVVFEDALNELCEYYIQKYED
jgi:dTDP-glucose 4,6-dehydratase